MKKLIIILMLTLTSNVFSQLAPPPQKFNLHLEYSNHYKRNEVKSGPFIMLGGASLLAAGLLTVPVMIDGSTTKQKSFLQQGARSLAIVTGSLVLTAGLVITIAGR